MRRIGTHALVLLTFAAAPAAAADGESIVVTASALPGTAINPDVIAVNIQSISGDDLGRLGTADLLSSLANEFAGVSPTEAQGNPFQPDVFYRGFEASPLAGDGQGLAVYANGVRVNQAFGDTVNWDLIP